MRAMIVAVVRAWTTPPATVAPVSTSPVVGSSKRNTTVAPEIAGKWTKVAEQIKAKWGGYPAFKEAFAAWGE